jgi:hypothetical protein
MFSAPIQSRATDISASEHASADTGAIPTFFGQEGRGYRARRRGRNQDQNGLWGKDDFASCVS